jgi:hypothetical protein
MRAIGEIREIRVYPRNPRHSLQTACSRQPPPA